MKGCYIIVLVVERYENKTQGYALLAQLVEQRTLNPSVQSSSLCAPTIFQPAASKDAAGYLFPAGYNVPDFRRGYSLYPVPCVFVSSCPVS